MMWTTDLGSLALTRNTPRNSEALASYARLEFGEANVAWFLAEARRAAKRPKARRPFGKTQTGDQGIASTA